MSNRQKKSVSNSKRRDRQRRKADTKYRLTVAADKLAILLRLPKSTIKIIDGMARENKSKRTSVIYDIIGAHPLLAESMQPLISNARS